jgi:putative inorganic carbon (HCO3(-)) transporter
MNSTANTARRIFTRWDWLLVLAMAPVMLFPPVHLVWLLLFYILVLAFQWWAWREAFPLTPLNPAILLMAFMVAVSIFVTPDLINSLVKITGVLLGILVFSTVARHSRTRQGWKISLVLFTMAAVGVTFLGLLGTNWLPSRLPELNDLIARLPVRLISLPGAEKGINANELAGALVWVVPLLVLSFLGVIVDPQWFASRNGKGRFQGGILAAWIMWLGLTLLFCAGTLVLSQSRDGYLAMLAAAPILLVVMARRSMRYWMAGLILAALIVGVIILSHGGPQVVLNQLFENLPAKGVAFSANTMFGRISIWKVAIRAIQDNPLVGLGMNVFRDAIHSLDPTFQNPAINVPHAHDEILQAALDLGLPGLIAFFALYTGSVGMLIRVIRSTGARRLLGIGIFGGLLAHFLFGLTDAVALGAKPGFLFWWLLAMAYGLIAQSFAGEGTQA